MIIQEFTNDLFPALPTSSKVWIYQANRFFSEQEEVFIQEKATAFVQQWESHGSLLKADFTLRHHLFLLLSVDEKQHEASGCSIDKSVRFIKEVENTLGISFFDRTVIAYFDQAGKINLTPMAGLKSLIQSGEITSKTLIFNNLPNDLLHLRAKWTIPAEDSWLARFF